MRIEGVDAHQPGSFAFFTHELDGLIGTPGGLMISGLDSRAEGRLYLPALNCFRAVGLVPIDALVSQPTLIVVPLRGPERLGLGLVTPLEDAAAVVGTLLHAALRGRQMQLADQATVIAHIRQHAGDQLHVFGEIGVAVAVDVYRAGVAPCQKGGPTGKYKPDFA